MIEKYVASSSVKVVGWFSSIHSKEKTKSREPQKRELKSKQNGTYLKVECDRIVNTAQREFSRFSVR